MLRYQEIFVAGGFPKFTYNPRWSLQLEPKVELARDNLCKLVTVTGHTKSGKTVLVRKVFPREQAIWIDGGTVSDAEDFWGAVVEQLGLHQEIQDQQASETSTNVGGKASAGAHFVIAKGTGEISGTIAKTKKTSVTVSRTLSSKLVALRALSKARIPLVIDDFHYLKRDLQAQIIRSIKPLVFEGLPVVLIAIPQRRFDAVRVEREMTGRIHAVAIPEWSEMELRFIPHEGFKLLKRPSAPDFEEYLAKQAIGSPHVMQELCREVCRVHAVYLSAVDTPLALAESDVDAVLQQVAESLGRPIFEKIARAPYARTTRMQRRPEGGRVVTTAGLILRALAHVRPGLDTLEYEEIRNAIRSVSKSGMPRRPSILRVLREMAAVAATDESSTPVVDFEELEGRLHITDPLFAFFLRWGRLDG